MKCSVVNIFAPALASCGNMSADTRDIHGDTAMTSLFAVFVPQVLLAKLMDDCVPTVIGVFVSCIVAIPFVYLTHRWARPILFGPECSPSDDYFLNWRHALLFPLIFRAGICPFLICFAIIHVVFSDNSPLATWIYAKTDKLLEPITYKLSQYIPPEDISNLLIIGSILIACGACVIMTKFLFPQIKFQRSYLRKKYMIIRNASDLDDLPFLTSQNIFKIGIIGAVVLAIVLFPLPYCLKLRTLTQDMITPNSHSPTHTMHSTPASTTEHKYSRRK